MKHKFYIVVLLIAMLFFPSGGAWADRGIISPYDYVEVEEPVQKAIILWNGSREALYLTTDVFPRHLDGGSGKIELIEVLPLPSSPEVKMADEKTFSNLNRLLQEKKARMSIYGYGPAAESSKVGFDLIEEEYPGVYIEFYRMVGLHNLTVVRVENLDSFIRWMDNYYKGIKGENFTLPSWMRVRVEDYLARGINHFVFDYISVYLNRVNSVKPLVFFFNTTRLYYPMYISAGLQGYGQVRLFIITDQVLPEKTISRDLGFRIDDKIPLRKSELKSINSTMYNFPLKNYLQLYVVTSYVSYSTGSTNLDLYVESEGVYTPPMYNLIDLFLFIAIFAALMGIIYFLWRRNLRKK